MHPLPHKGPNTRIQGFAAAPGGAMYEIDFLPVGKKAGDKWGDAIALRFVPPNSQQWAQVVIDAGFKDDGKALVEHVNTYYDPGRLDLAILTHPDEDHINGMGGVLRGLDVDALWPHRIGAHGGDSLPAADAVEDLIALANEHPSGRVINAYERRGCSVHATVGTGKWHHNGDIPMRAGWSTATPLGPMVEEEETEG
jgi:hypothetical protein